MNNLFVLVVFGPDLGVPIAFTLNTISKILIHPTVNSIPARNCSLRNIVVVAVQRVSITTPSTPITFNRLTVYVK